MVGVLVIEGTCMFVGTELIKSFKLPKDTSKSKDKPLAYTVSRSESERTVAFPAKAIDDPIVIDKARAKITHTALISICLFRLESWRGHEKKPSPNFTELTDR